MKKRAKRGWIVGVGVFNVVHRKERGQRDGASHALRRNLSNEELTINTLNIFLAHSLSKIHQLGVQQQYNWAQKDQQGKEYTYTTYHAGQHESAKKDNNGPIDNSRKGS